MRDDREFAEDIAIAECREGDRIRIPHRIGRGIHGQFVIHRMKPIGGGRVQLKCASTWNPGNAKVRKIDLPDDLVVERRPPVQTRVEVTDGAATVIPGDGTAAVASAAVATRQVDLEAVARSAISAILQRSIWHEPPL